MGVYDHESYPTPSEISSNPVISGILELIRNNEITVNGEDGSYPDGGTGAELAKNPHTKDGGGILSLT